MPQSAKVTSPQVKLAWRLKVTRLMARPAPTAGHATAAELQPIARRDRLASRLSRPPLSNPNAQYWDDLVEDFGFTACREAHARHTRRGEEQPRQSWEAPPSTGVSAPVV